MQKRADEMCEELEKSGLIYKNKELEDYLTLVTNNLLPEEIKNSGIKIEVKVINEPTLNAFALPNNRIYVHTGMLSAIDNESQAATLLGHELTHILNRHSLKEFRSVINKSAFFSAIQAPAAVFVGDLGVIFAQLAIISSIYGYSKDLESEADREGFNMVRAQGYDVNESVKLFGHLKKFIKDEEIKVPFFFSTHPNVVTRIKSYEVLIKENGLAQTERKRNNRDGYSRLIDQLLLDDFSLCLGKGMFKSGERVINKFLNKNPNDPKGYFYLGELCRQRQDHSKKEKKRDKAPDYVKAIEAYDKAIAINLRYADAFKGKGRICQKQGDIINAKSAFQKYLELNPQADDREYLEQFISAN